MNSPEQESTSPSERSITTRLETATRELNELEELVKSGSLDSRVLSEFREAVDHIRSTTWAVQKWIGPVSYTHLVNERAVLVAQGIPIVAVHILDVEEIAITAHDFVEDFHPLLLRNTVHQQRCV